MTPDALGQIASTGLAGAMLVVALFALRAKDRELRETLKAKDLELSAEKSARIADARDNLQLIMKLQEQVIMAVNKLSELVEMWEERELRAIERDRAEHERRAAAGTHGTPYLRGGPPGSGKGHP